MAIIRRKRNLESQSLVLPVAIDGMTPCKTIETVGGVAKMSGYTDY